MSIAVGMVLAPVVFLACLGIRAAWRGKREGVREEFFSAINALSEAEVSDRLRMDIPDPKRMDGNDLSKPMEGVLLHRPYLTDVGRVIGSIGPSKYLEAPVTLLVEEPDSIALIDAFSAKEQQRMKSLAHVLLFEREAAVRPATQDRLEDRESLGYAQKST